MKFKSSKILLSLLALCGCVNAAEVKKTANIYTPFCHQSFFQGERELLGYKPKYQPGLISFDEANIPYIRTRKGEIQTLAKSGKWLKLDFKPAIKAAYPKWDGKLFNGAFAEERIVFDKQGNAYMHVMISRNKPESQSLILYSRDHCRSWQVYPLPKKFIHGWYVKIENTPSVRRSSVPPVISIFNGKTLYLIISSKIKNGLKFSAPALISKSVFASPTHSGGGNFTVTVPGKTFVVFASSVIQPGKVGTPQFITVFDHASRRCAAPVYMGNNGHGKPDGHNLPSIEADSKGYLHVLLGSHHDPFIYFRSKTPYDISQWTVPEKIGYPKTKMAEGSYTYIGIICDPFDNLHLTARWAGAGYKNYLVYIKKPAGKSWLKQKILVEPFKTLYSVYYHKMSQDLRGRIFVNYSYYGNELTDEQAIAYNKKWPEHKILSPAGKAKLTPNGSWYKVKNNDPVSIVSNDSGDSFRLALTEDFVAGKITVSSKSEIINNSINMPLAEIPAGAFIMGSLNGAYDEKPLRPVFFNKSFLLGQYPVRVKDFKEFIKATGYKTEFEQIINKKLIYNWCGGKFLPGDNRTWQNPGFKQSPNDPVVMITIADINAFCKWLSKKEKAVYRLPTEAEWEYACRAGSITSYYFGNDNKLLPRYAWYKANAIRTKTVGMLLPNAWGLHDMNGNVWEYCSDYYVSKRSDLPATNPLPATVKVSGPVIRGGSWIDDWYGDTNGVNLRSATRYHIVYPLMQLDWVGFRILKEK
jgi:formylglycine-generating enzyme required for sulfatase activity